MNATNTIHRLHPTRSRRESITHQIEACRSKAIRFYELAVNAAIGGDLGKHEAYTDRAQAQEFKAHHLAYSL